MSSEPNATTEERSEDSADPTDSSSGSLLDAPDVGTTTETTTTQRGTWDEAVIETRDLDVYYG